MSSRDAREPRSLRRVSSKLPTLVDEHPARWAFGSLVGAIALAAVVRALYSVTLASDNLAVGLTGVLFAVLVAGAVVSILILAYWRILTGPEDDAPYFLAAVFSLAAIALSVEAFAGLTTLLAKHDLVTTSSSGEFTIWNSEEMFLWHVADAVPLLDIPDTMQWTRPDRVINPVFGTLVVLFRLSSVVPILGLAVAGYRRGQRAVATAINSYRLEKSNTDSRPVAAETWRVRVRWHATHFTHSVSSVALVVIGIVLLSALSHVVIRVAIEDSSPLHSALATPARDGVTLFDRHVELGWLPESIDVAVALVLTGFGLWLCTLAAAVLYLPLMHGSRIAQFASAVAGVSLLLPICLAAAALSVALMHVDLFTTIPPADPGEEYGAAVAWYGWHAAGGVPLLEIPNAFSWTLRHQFTDRWSGALLILVRVATVAAVLWPIGLIATMIVHPTLADPTDPVDGLVADVPSRHFLRRGDP